jgi:uncharacterized protein
MFPAPPILSLGTAVVALTEIRGPDGRELHPRGAAGLIIRAPADPEHSYRIRFPGGDEATLKRRDLEVLKHYIGGTDLQTSAGGTGLQTGGASLQTGPLAARSLHSHVIYRCITGSRAYGLDRDDSDTDRRGIYLPPASMHWSIYGVPEQLEDPAREECYWELEKFLKLALKANPNVLEALYTPLVEHADPLAAELLAMRSVFLSRLVYQTYSGYAMSQFRKIEQDVRNAGAVKWKHAMHLIRLLLSGITALREGVVPVRVETHRDRLLAIRDGAMPWEDVDTWRRALHAEFDEAYGGTRLPERPDYDAANAFLVRARREMARRET